MKILITHEKSGTIRRAFRALGHSAISCDLRAADDGDTEHHAQMDASEAIRSISWDLIIMHPVCTKLCVSGNAHYAEGKPKYKERLEAITVVEKLWNIAQEYSPRVCLENPVGVLSTRSNLGKASQGIQPYQFGHDASKKTLLWLHGLPKLRPAEFIEPRMVEGKPRWANQCDSGQNNARGSGEDRADIRAETYGGIAEAMAKQWGIL